MDWDQFVAQERKKLDEEQAKLVAMFTEAGVRLDSLPKVDFATMEPEVRQKLEMEYGIDFDKIPKSKPAGASAWRQRTKMVMV